MRLSLISSHKGGIPFKSAILVCRRSVCSRSKTHCMCYTRLQGTIISLDLLRGWEPPELAISGHHVERYVPSQSVGESWALHD